MLQANQFAAVPSKDNDTKRIEYNEIEVMAPMYNINNKERNLLAFEKKYLLIAMCLKCNFSMSTSVDIEAEQLTSARLSFLERVASLHTKHPHFNNFNVSATEI